MGFLGGYMLIVCLDDRAIVKSYKTFLTDPYPDAFIDPFTSTDMLIGASFYD